MARNRLISQDLEVGNISKVPRENGKQVGKVIEQKPEPGQKIKRGESVELTVAAKPAGEEERQP